MNDSLPSLGSLRRARGERVCVFCKDARYMIHIVDYGMGNLRSVQKAFEALGYAAETTDDPEAVHGAERVVVPGVGAFPDAMANLRAKGLDDAVTAFAATGRPLLGVCLGLQLFFEESEEYGPHRGLGLFPGKVRGFPADMTVEGQRLKVPHMGWNTLRVKSPTFAYLADEYVYFVHSYYVQAARDEDAAAETDYGLSFCSLAAKDNVWAAQFHPEKSGAVGQKLLAAFARV